MGWHGVGAWIDKDIDCCNVGEVWTSESGVWVGCGNLDWMSEAIAEAIGSKSALGLIMSLATTASPEQNVMDKDENSWRDMGWETSDFKPNSLE